MWGSGGVNAGVFKFISPTSVIEKVCSRERNINIARLADRLTVI
jgi:hypothetical protein